MSCPGWSTSGSVSTAENDEVLGVSPRVCEPVSCSAGWLSWMLNTLNHAASHHWISNGGGNPNPRPDWLLSIKHLIDRCANNGDLLEANPRCRNSIEMYQVDIAYINIFFSYEKNPILYFLEMLSITRREKSMEKNLVAGTRFESTGKFRFHFACVLNLNSLLLFLHL